MPAPKWQPSTTYIPGAIVQPDGTATPTTKTGQPDNADFESGSTGWTLPTGFAIDTTVAFSGTQSLKFSGVGTGVAVSTDRRAVIPGQSVSVSCVIKGAGNIRADNSGSRVRLVWYDASSAELSESIDQTNHPITAYDWRATSVTGYAPAGAAFVAVGVGATIIQADEGPLWADKFAWNYAPPNTPNGLLFKAVQAAPGKSAGTEPKWPSTLGVTVVDNQVTWEAVEGTLIEWTASPLHLSGGTEPTWPTEPGALVNDNGITWKATSPQITDPNCPNSKIVTSAANKIFEGSGDIVPFCATNDASDWSSEQDAGYLPTGLRAIGETQCTALAIYRSNLVAWTASSLQVWQVDPDPANMAIIDTVEGAGTSYLRTPAGMMNDLYFLSALGVRSVGITATTGTMGATDVGSPVDPPIRAALTAYNTAIGQGERPVWDPLGIYYANANQYWLILGNEAYVYSLSSLTKVSAWSHYTFGFYVTDACTLDGQLYVRDSDSNVYVLDETVFADNGVQYDVQAQLPWLDFGAPGATKLLVGVDVVFAQGAVGANTFVSAGWDENNTASLTPEVALSQDTLPGTIVPIPAAGPALSIRLRNASADSWECSAITVYYNAQRATA